MSYMILWSFLTGLTIILSVIFGYMFYKDKDKRKLIFALSFIFAAPSCLLMNYGWENAQTYDGVYWGVLPVSAAYLIVVVSSILNLQDFEKQFKMFLIVLGVSTFLMFVPFNVKDVLPIVMQTVASVAIVASVYLYTKKRETSNLIFILSMLCFSLGGIGIGLGLEAYFTTFAFAFAYIFIGLVFLTAKENTKGDVASFFSLKDELENTKQELRQYSEHLEELVEKRTEALKESQELLVKSERLAAIGQAATMVGHDLRNPLQAIENATYCLGTELSKTSSSAATASAIQVIYSSIEYADSIVNNLLCFASTKKPVFIETDINELINDTSLHINIPDKTKIIIDAVELPKIEGDKQMLKRVFVNLAVNAIQAMEPNGGSLKISTKQTEKTIQVTFKDTGTGIPEEHMQKIFTPFFTTKAQGMGVGLAICKRFVEQHNGTIEVESVEEEGSIFTVNLPIERDGGEKA